MRRRDLLFATVPALLHAQEKARFNGPATISAVEMIRVEGRRKTEAGDAKGQHQVNPLHIYEEHRPAEYHERTKPAGEVRASAYYLRIATKEGVEGLYGPIDTEAAIVVYQQLRNFLIGKDALAGETLWDKMYRSNRHSRSSHFMMAISAVDNALWDLRGRYFSTPVYRLLGGPTRKQVEVYGSCLGHSVEPERMRKTAAEFKRQGFRHQKWFMPLGPGDGAAGLQKNVDMVRHLREAVGNDADLMFDAFMGWDLNYAVQWAKQVEQYRPRWIEEAFHVDKLESFAALRRATTVPVATGEHFYGRWEVQHFLRADAITVVQADPEWCGGVSELMKICHIASAYDAQVIPHGHSIHSALHVVASQSPMTCPLVEYLISKMSSYYWFEKWDPKPVNGKITLPETPGFGIVLDEAKIEKRTVATWG
ncbi:MAG TPA: enolase C-terminal domain-like protein [Bryobacteraceae bacterium]|nr:enolase C-terminal domain-like protein [Bryobacteraceae bacterium]